MDKQTVWRTFSATESCGFFVWEVLEMMGEPLDYLIPNLHKCRDGSYILIQRYHSESREASESVYTENIFGDQEIVLID